MKSKSYEGKPPKRLFPPELQDLLLSEGQEVIGSDELSLGTGCIPVLGTARAGKSTLVASMVDWVIHHTNRKVIYADFPPIFIEEGIPEHWKGRVESRPLNQLHRVGQDENAVWVLDDVPVSLNSRRSSANSNIQVSQLAGIISHLGGGQTIIFSAQSLAGVDKTMFRYTEVVTVCRYMSASGLKGERDEWREEVEQAQYLLRQAHGNSSSKRLRDFFVCISSDRRGNPFRIVPYIKPTWLFEEMSEKQKDILSRPFRYMDGDQLAKIIRADDQPKRPRGRPKKEVSE